jgi:radical SAM superfamily enzyme YgiQ (UPF0313 family)
MPIKIALADFTHTGQAVTTNSFPLAIGIVAAHAIKHFGERIQVELLKYPEDYTRYMEVNGAPDIAGFSNYSWNSRISYAFAERVKAHSPETAIIFGGVNYPILESEQEAFLCDRPAIDFYVFREGEDAFVNLIRKLEAVDFDASALQASGEPISSVHYLKSNRIVCGELLPRIKDLTETPSPHQLGLFDKMYDEILIPMIETNRGCPYSCTFCQEGQRYYSKVSMHGEDRVLDDLEYISKRVQVPDLMIVDSNFGMYRQDISAAKKIAEIQERTGWPKYVYVDSAKNTKDKVLEVSRIVNGAMRLTASVQSLDDNVLKHIKRTNISSSMLTSMAQEAADIDADNGGEIILCLPGDSKKAHFRSVSTLVDADLNYLMQHQLQLLPSSELETGGSREKYQMQSRFRVLPRCFGIYEVFGERFGVAEVEEVCVANNTMSFEDYVDCRTLNFTVEIFYNGSVFREVIEFLKLRNIANSQFVERVYKLASAADSPIADVYESFRRETRDNLWDTRGELIEFIEKPDIIQKYIDGEYGNNELFKHRAIVFFYRLQEAHDIAFQAARELLAEDGALDGSAKTYLDELKKFSLCRKRDLLKTDRVIVETFKYDFLSLSGVNYRDDPTNHLSQEGATICLTHSGDQQEMLSSYAKQYGDDINGLGRILFRSDIRKLYRSGAHVEDVGLIEEIPFLDSPRNELNDIK